ncbi:MAG TPA: helix-hairpin-helix domain-containing protein [Polyangiaceae bacterium]|nr:helix-hairpin-helix domain-containing protein [Polyangiaceae bacterium]
MTKLHEEREATPRADEGRLSLSEQVRGRSTAPRASVWGGALLKMACAAVAAVVLAIIGAKAGANEASPTNAPTDPGAPAAASAVPPTPPPRAPASSAALALAEVVSPDAGVQPSSSGSGTLADGRVVLNAALEEDLTKLSGIGPTRARAILALRQRLGKFRAVEDLLRVKGIGRKTLRRLRPNLVLDRPPAAEAANATAG